MNRRELEDQIIARAWQDDSFKEELVSNPEAALSREGISLPESIEVKVLEENTNILYIVLPPKPSEELSDAELESVAGGGWGKGKTKIGPRNKTKKTGGGGIPIPIRTR